MFSGILDIENSKRHLMHENQIPIECGSLLPHTGKEVTFMELTLERFCLFIFIQKTPKFGVSWVHSDSLLIYILNMDMNSKGLLERVRFLDVPQSE